MLLSSFASFSTEFASPLEEEEYDDQPIELDPLDDPGNDDSEASDLVVGEEIDVLGEGDGENEPIELDLGSLIGGVDSFIEGEDDQEGVEVDPALGIALPQALTPDDGAEGLDDGDVVVDESKFPSLEMDDGSEGIAAEREISLGSSSDEAPIPRAAVPWLVQLPATALEACGALAVGREQVVAGSSDLLWIRTDSSSPLRVGVDGSAISDLALLGESGDLALCCTHGGQLFRRARFASQAEQLARVREHVRGSRVRLALGGELCASPGRVLLWSSEGTLLEVLESGDRFERIALDGKVLAAARESCRVLLGRGRERWLVTLDGQQPSSSALSGPALLVAQSDAPLLASAGARALALGEYGRALLVSNDSGSSFRRVPGTGNTTALVGAELAGKPVFFAAVYRETSDHSEIVLIDPERSEATMIARLDASGDHVSSDAIERGEWAKVARLAYHAPSERLWVTGGFGVLSVTPSVRP